MSGHNKWKQIKHKKAAVDQARGKLYSKLANNISIAARSGTDPKFNSSLRSMIDQAKKQNMPMINIERAIKKASSSPNLEQMLIEAYGPHGVGILVDINTNNKNRAISEIRSLFKEYNAKIADPGSLLWSFEKTKDGYRPLRTITPPDDAQKIIESLVKELKKRGDVVGVYPAINVY